MENNVENNEKSFKENDKNAVYLSLRYNLIKNKKHLLNMSSAYA